MWKVLSLLLLPVLVAGHGRLVQPPSRASMWRLGFNNPANYDDTGLNCGGGNSGNCGVCGDRLAGPWPHEAGGKYANGVIGATFQPGQTITVELGITAQHFGWYEFRLCPNNDPTKRVTHACLEQYKLPINGGGTRYQIPRSARPGKETLQVKLPAGLTCTQCVLQWKWFCGNSWGVDPDTGNGCVGCGPQEQFYGCSDIAIRDDTQGTTPAETPAPTQGPTNGPTNPPPTQGPTQGPTDPPPTQGPTQGPTDPPPTQGPTQGPTNPPPTTTTPPEPTFIPGVGCTAIGDWAGMPGMNEWCVSNCAHVPPHCPSERCRCENN